jgi:lysophospholipase L1-like esterase
MKGLVRALVISALLLFGAATASPATADPPTTPVAPVQLALGDSWPAGARAMPPSEGYVPQLYERLKEDFNCSGDAPEQAQAGCPQLQLVNIADGGETTPTLIRDQLPVAEDLLELRNGNLDPRDDVEVTTLHIGGNDVFTPVIGACLTPDFIATGVLSDFPCLSTINGLFNAYRANLTTVLSGLRNAAGDSDARIVIGTYDNPIFAPCPLAAIPRAHDLADIVLEGDSPQLAQGLHDIMGEVAANYDVEVADVFGDLDGPQFWAGDCLHPNNLGYDQVTNAFLEVFGLAPSG